MTDQLQPDSERKRWIAYRMPGDRWQLMPPLEVALRAGVFARREDWERERDYLDERHANGKAGRNADVEVLDLVPAEASDQALAQAVEALPRFELEQETRGRPYMTYEVGVMTEIDDYSRDSLDEAGQWIRLSDLRSATTQLQPETKESE